jgi:dienelactone hydrolase
MIAKTRRMLIATLAVVTITLCVLQLERAREGIVMTEMAVGSTPTRLYRMAGATGPAVVVAHGFAGSRQLMEAFSLTLARAGYAVLAFDFHGHGRHPTPMSGDVAAIDGTTARLVRQTREVIAAARELAGDDAPVALVGHSMATDIIVRAARDEPGLDTVVAVSMFSEAVTAQAPRRLLIVTGAWEPRLREVARDALRLIDSDAQEGDTVASGDVLRRAVVAPYVEHVGVLFSPTTLRETRDWLDQASGRQSDTPVAATGPWILGLLAGILLLFWPLARLVPRGEVAQTPISVRQFLMVVGLPTVLAPLGAVTLHSPFLPVLVADYLMVHLALFGIIQLVVLGLTGAWRWPGFGIGQIAGAVLLLVWGIAVFGLALDRYAASFVPTQDRLLIIGVLALGTVPFMMADALVSGAGQGVWWRRILARVAVFVSLTLAAVADPQELGFVLIIFPVLLLFFLVYGTMGRWVAQRGGALAAGPGLGLVLAWSLGVSFPLFS